MTSSKRLFPWESACGPVLGHCDHLEMIKTLTWLRIVKLNLLLPLLLYYHFLTLNLNLIMHYGYVYSMIPYLSCYGYPMFYDYHRLHGLLNDVQDKWVVGFCNDIYPNCDGFIWCLTRESCGNSRLGNKHTMSRLTRIPMRICRASVLECDFGRF